MGFTTETVPLFTLEKEGEQGLFNADQLEARKADGWVEVAPESPDTGDTVKMKKGRKIEDVPADQLEARKADGWEVVDG